MTTTDPLGDWFRHIGTKLSDTDYEAGIKALSCARDQFHPMRTTPTDAEVRAAAEAIARGTYPDLKWRELSWWQRDYNTKCARAALLAARNVARHE